MGGAPGNPPMVHDPTARWCENHRVSPGIVISLVVVAAVVIGAFALYKRYLRSLAPDDRVRQVSGARLTSERLHELPTPPWRIVYEIGEDRLGGVDHVVIGPSGIIAVATTMADRPAPDATADAHLVAAAAMLRSGVDDLARRAGMPCDTLAKVFWGAPQPGRPAAFESMHATLAVEGQRLTEWLATLPPGPFNAAQVDLGWQAIVTGIGRPDPLA
jgi:hypothetical protein